MTLSLSHEIQKTSILIVEDSPTQAEQLKELLIHAGYAVTVATNGKVALSILETAIPDLVITDIVMPEIDGYTLCKTIKQDEQFKRIPVILVTSLYDLQDVIKGLESGANNFIIKPYHEKYLLSRIEIVLANFQYEDTEAIQMGIDITLAGQKIHITSSPLQILNILLSTYETATQKNQELVEAKKQLKIINEDLEVEIQERQHAEEVIRETLSILNSAIETTVNGLLVVNTSRKITTYNKKFADMWNLPDSILMSQDERPVLDSIIRQVKNPEAFTGAVNELYATPDLEKFETIELLDNRTIDWYSKPQRIGDTIVGRVWSFQDISSKKQLEDKIERSLKEKEMLLKEIHHRVKNNMQVISGLLLLQSQNTTDETTRLLFKESQNRIRSISLVHEQLYRSDNFSQIEYGDYLRKMFSPLFESYKVDGRKVKMVIDVLPVMISIEKAVPCSLMVNELLSNSLKHAFPNG
ncbi:MAG: histidine kinase dimerization/phosphoacceptor domain -containing protein, partial [Methanobacteriota archaeon]